MLFSILHETGHIIMGLMLKIKPKQLEIMPFGIAVSFCANNTNQDEKKLKIK